MTRDSAHILDWILSALGSQRPAPVIVMGKMLYVRIAAYIMPDRPPWPPPDHVRLFGAELKVITDLHPLRCTIGKRTRCVWVEGAK